MPQELRNIMVIKKVAEIQQLVEDLESIGVVSTSKEEFVKELISDHDSVEAWKHILAVVASEHKPEFVSPKARRLLATQIRLHTKKTDKHRVRIISEPLGGVQEREGGIMKSDFWDNPLYKKEG